MKVMMRGAEEKAGGVCKKKNNKLKNQDAQKENKNRKKQKKSYGVRCPQS